MYRAIKITTVPLLFCIGLLLSNYSHNNNISKDESTDYNLIYSESQKFVESDNLEPIDQITQMTVTLELAGMQFLSSEERLGANANKNRVRIPTGSSNGVTGAVSGSGRSRGGAF